ncbi:hypothetical protein DW687_11985 [Anaerofustis stercorihominis]|uniref:Uncharacterized protein n=1 Tax=Anaerofustis stercorihominis TaxID=214853 RepID=A0A3E3DUM6_9FIRM|nr:hypothetical protein DW687_11985 [Anaerofustis stercorihominis]
MIKGIAYSPNKISSLFKKVILFNNRKTPHVKEQNILFFKEFQLCFRKKVYKKTSKRDDWLISKPIHIKNY